MLAWAVVNVLLNVLALLFIAVNRGSPHRLRFQVAVWALAAWLVPWPLLSWSMPDFLAPALREIPGYVHLQILETVPMEETQVLPLVSAQAPSFATKAPSFPSPAKVLLVLACLTGLGLFAASLKRHFSLLRRLEGQSRPGDFLAPCLPALSPARIRVQREIPGAISSGLLRPTIWVHEDLLTSRELKVVLPHEATHIEQWDNWYLALITCVERFLWWNPLALLLANRARSLQEWSCDERCALKLPDYRLSLARLLMERQGAGPVTAFASGMLGGRNQDVRRLRILERRYLMKKRHLLGTFAFCCATLFVIGVVTAQDSSSVSGTLTAPAHQSMRPVEAAVPEQGAVDERQIVDLMQLIKRGEAVMPPELIAQQRAIREWAENEEISLTVPNFRPEDVDEHAYFIGHFSFRGAGAVKPDANGILRRARPFHIGPNGEIVPEDYIYLYVKNWRSGETRYYFDLENFPLLGFVRSLGLSRTESPPPGTWESGGPRPGRLHAEVGDPAAEGLLVPSLRGENLSFSETLDLLRQSSGCDVIQVEQALVIDWCG